MGMRDAIDGRIALVRRALGTLALETLAPLKEEILRYPTIETRANERLENEMVRNVARRIRGREEHCCFTHLLLDSGVIGEIQWEDATREQKWTTFVRSIIYVGKGKNLRPYDHLNDAYKILTADNEQNEVPEKVRNAGKKMQRILKIWSEGNGVIILKAFGFIKSEEAQTREAVIIDTLGLPSLCNEIHSTYYDGGVLQNLNPNQKLNFGKYLLLQMMRELTADKIPVTPYML